MTKTIIDIEPKWIDLVRLWKMQNKNVSDEYVYSELKKMAKVMDIIRQGQKNKDILIIKDGNAYTVDKETKKKIKLLLKESK